MNLLGGLFLYFGYVLVYAAVAKHGRFATHPWLGVVADAYTGETLGRGGSGQSPGASAGDASSSSPGPSGLAVQRAAVVTHGPPMRRRGVPA